MRRIFEIFREKGSIPATIRQLKLEGITTKRHIRSDGQTIGGHDWTLNSLWHVLRNRHYVAEREINKANRTLDKEDVPKGKDYRLAQASWPAFPQAFSMRFKSRAKPAWDPLVIGAFKSPS